MPVSSAKNRATRRGGGGSRPMTHESPVCLRVVSKALLCEKLFARKVEVNEETQVLDQLRGRNKQTCGGFLVML